MSENLLHPDRLFPTNDKVRGIARSLYASVKDLNIISPHGHTDPNWFSDDNAFSDPVELLLKPDHYVLRMLYSQGIQLENLGVDPIGGEAVKPVREAWRLFAKYFYLFRGTPSALWLNHVFFEIFGLQEAFEEKTADLYYDAIAEALKRPEFRPRALFEKFKIEVLATTDAPTDSLSQHTIIRHEWKKRVIPTYRPDSCVDPEHPEFFKNLNLLGVLTGENTETLPGFIKAHEKRRAFFKSVGATATDHGHPTAKTLTLSESEATQLFAKIIQRESTPLDAENFRAYMLMEMARMSIDDGLVMQLHPGSFRNHNQQVLARYGRDKGADIPTRAEYTQNLKPLLDRFGNDHRLTLILFTLDESTYSRELAPLAGHYPALLLGPPWWFHDSPEGMIRFRERVTETAGFYNTAGFNDDTRAFFSIPARHDMARRIDCRMLAQWVAEHRLSESEAFKVILDLSQNLVKRAYKL